MRGWAGAYGTLAALALARVAFGFQLQTVASLGPELARAFGMDFATLGTLMGLYMIPGVLVAIPCGFIARRIGDRDVVAAGLAMMAAGSLLSAAATGPWGIGAGRVLSGAGAVAMTVMQGKIMSDRYQGRRFTMLMGVLVGAFPIGIGLAQLLQHKLATAYGWPAAFIAGCVAALLALGSFLATWTGAPHAAPRTLAWPPRRETALVVVSGLIWTAYNAAYFNFLSFMPSYLAAHGHPVWVADTVMTFATWGNMPAILLGGALASRFGPNRVFVAGTLLCAASVAGSAVLDMPLLWGAVFGTVASMHGGLIIEIGTLSARPENRAVGMGIFYTTYYLGGAGLPALCGKAADLAGDPVGAFLAAAGLSLLALPFYFWHRSWARARA